MSPGRKWFESWFDSPYYHALYENRDQHEAQRFLDNLLTFLDPPRGASVLDVACGRGRHALHLHSKGYRVSAYDLSASNIAYDKAFESDTLKFYIHDMRQVFRLSDFDLILILFSSFGYFDSEEENLGVLAAHAAALKPGGRLVLDYLNAGYLAECIREQEDKNAGGICFHIQKRIEEGVVNKTISFHDQGQDYRYEERVRLYSLDDFRKMFTATGLELVQIFGNYDLAPYHASASPRLILVAEKK